MTVAQPRAGRACLNLRPTWLALFSMPRLFLGGRVIMGQNAGGSRLFETPTEVLAGFANVAGSHSNAGWSRVPRLIRLIDGKEA